MVWYGLHVVFVHTDKFVSTDVTSHLSGTHSVNAHESVDYQEFANWWNQAVSNNEKQQNFHTGIFRKTRSLLQQYGTERKKIINIHNTISGMTQSGDEVIPR